MIYKFNKVKINKRTQHLDQVIQKHLINILQTEIQDPRIKWVTVNQVQLNKDKSMVTIYYSVLGAMAERQQAELALKTAKGFIRSKLASRLTIYKMPALKFIFNEAVIYSPYCTGNMDLETIDITQNEESADR